MNQIGTVDEWVTVLSFLGAVVSMVISFVAAHRGLVGFRTLHAGIGTLCAVYAAGYLWLFFGDPSVALWSSVMRGFSLTAWIMVWAAPAWLSITVNRELHAAIRKRTEQEEGGEE